MPSMLRRNVECPFVLPIDEIALVRACGAVEGAAEHVFVDLSVVLRQWRAVRPGFWAEEAL